MNGCRGVWRSVSSPTVPLFTSVPPGDEAAGSGPAAAVSLPEKIVAGWRDAGFAPVSVNTAVELGRRPDLRQRLDSLSLPVIVVDRSGTRAGAASDDRDPRCTMSEFLLAMHRQVPTGIVAIVNSDIGWAGAWTAQSVTDVVDAGGAPLGQRMDVPAFPPGGGVPTGVMDVHGADFVAFPAEAIPSLLGLVPAVLRFGMPWWDHYLPLALLMLGVGPRLVPPGTLWHVTHPQRWHMRTWGDVGLVAARQFAAAVRALPPNPASRTWMRLFDGRFAPAAAVDPVDRLVRLLIEASLCPGTLLRSRLGVLAGGNIALLLQAAAAIAAAGGGGGPPATVREDDGGEAGGSGPRW
jgi:hypothetical protein